MTENIGPLYKISQGDFSGITCGAEFEMITLDKEKPVPLNRTMISVSDSFVVDDTLPVWYGKNGKYYNTVGLINYILRAHRAELKSSYHVTFEVPEAPSEDEAFLTLHILDINENKIGTIMPDGLSYMPEIITNAWSVSEVKRRSTLIRSLIEFAVERIDGRIANKQLPYVLGNYDMINTIAGIPAKKDLYYRTLVNSLVYRWKILAEKNEIGIRKMRSKYIEELECPISLLQVKDCIGEDILKKRGFAHNVSTTSHHLHISWWSLKETIDMFISLMWYEGKIRYEFGVAYFEQLGKWYMRHIAFGSLIALRYRVSRKSATYLEKKWFTLENYDMIPDHIIQKLYEKNLWPPDLRISSSLSNGRDPEWSLACKVYYLVETALDKELSWEDVKKEILEMIWQKFFRNPDNFIASYFTGKNTVSGGLLRSHSDIVLKAPAEVEENQFILTVEMRGQDYPPLTVFARDETREAYVIQNNLAFLQRWVHQFIDHIQPLREE